MSRKKNPGRNAQNTPVSPVTHTRRTVIEWLGKGATMAALPPALSACFPEQKDFRCCAETDAPPGGGGFGGGDSGDSGTKPLDTAAGAECPEGAIEFAPPDADPALWDEFTVFTVDEQDLDSLLQDWVLTIDGMVDTPRTYTFQQLLELPRFDQIMDFHCVTGWSVHDVPWNGVHIQTLLDAAGIQSNATHITFHTVDSIYNESLPLDVALEPHTMLAFGLCGLALPLDHGFPMRLIIPRLLAYKSAKYVHRLELTDAPLNGYWEQRGYSYDAEVPEDRLRKGRY